MRRPPQQGRAPAAHLPRRHPSQPGSDAIRIPAELNRRPTSIAAVGSYVSVVAGHQEYVENTTFLSATQVVGSAAQLREIRERAYECVRDFRQNRDEAFPVRQRRLTFERIADLLGELELDLSFAVEATADLGMLVPSLQLENYHNDLFESMNLAHRVETTSHMLAAYATPSPLNWPRSAASRTAPTMPGAPARSAVTFISTIAGTLALLFGFFGINGGPG